MTILEALAVFESSRIWSIKRSGCSLYLNDPEKRRRHVKTQVRRKKDESLAGMVIRCAELAQRRLLSGWAPPPPKPRKPEPPAVNGGTARQIEQARRVARVLTFDEKRRPS